MKVRPTRAAGALMVMTLATTLLAGAGIGQAATAPQNQFGIKLLQAPASEAGDPRADIYIIDHLNPGADISRNFQVSNTGSNTITLSLYPAAAAVSGGTFKFAAGHTQNEMTTWVHLNKSTVTLAPHTAATVTATVDVPKDATAGNDDGVIWAEQDAKGPGNVNLVSRVGIRMYLNIGPGGAPAAGFTVGTPTTSSGPNGTHLVSVPVNNTGGRAVDVRGSMSLTNGPGGLQAGPFNPQSMDTLAPGQSHPVTFALSSKLPEGPWQATFMFKSDLITKTEKVTLNLASGPATTAKSRKNFPIVPVAGGIGLFLILAVGAFFILRHRRTPGPRHA
ncbi:MAG TPA: hypothetical protein VN847_14400 [Streptosporangiaceae bacterium]|nr:hypothetical protein [Streptosporangiaceae bacterium]